MRPRLTLIATVVSGSISGNVESADQDAALGTVIVSAQQDGHEILSTATNEDDESLIIELRHNGQFIASTGADPDTGEFVFEDVTGRDLRPHRRSHWIHQPGCR